MKNNKLNKWKKDNGKEPLRKFKISWMEKNNKHKQERFKKNVFPRKNEINKAKSAWNVKKWTKNISILQKWTRKDNNLQALVNHKGFFFFLKKKNDVHNIYFWCNQ